MDYGLGLGRLQGWARASVGRHSVTAYAILRIEKDGSGPSLGAKPAEKWRRDQIGTRMTSAG